MPKNNFKADIDYYIEQYPDVYPNFKNKILSYMNKRWESAFNEVLRNLELASAAQSLPDITLICDAGVISKSDQKKFISDFTEVIRGLSVGRVLSDDGNWVDTRCLIGIIEGDICETIFCRGDGDLLHKGRILFDNYDENELKKLIKLGNVWVLGKYIGEKHDPTAPTPGYTIFHNRERGIKNYSNEYSSYVELLKFADWSIQPIFFIMKDGIWFIGAPKKNYGTVIEKGSILRLEDVLKLHQ
jgi:hypothetical protein